MKMENLRRVRACCQRNIHPPMMKGGDRVISTPVAIAIGIEGVPPMLWVTNPKRGRKRGCHI